MVYLFLCFKISPLMPEPIIFVPFLLLLKQWGLTSRLASSPKTPIPFSQASTGGLLCHDTTRLLPRVHEPRGRKKYPSFFSLYFFHFLNPVPRLRGAPNLFFSFFTLSQFQVGVEGRVRDPFGRGGGF
ncbi:hypothetical protein HKD37_13G037824 [Glycine soja]